MSGDERIKLMKVKQIGEERYQPESKVNHGWEKAIWEGGGIDGQIGVCA